MVPSSRCARLGHHQGASARCAVALCSAPVLFWEQRPPQQSGRLRFFLSPRSRPIPSPCPVTRGHRCLFGMPAAVDGCWEKGSDSLFRIPEPGSRTGRRFLMAGSVAVGSVLLASGVALAEPTESEAQERYEQLQEELS